MFPADAIEMTSGTDDSLPRGIAGSIAPVLRSPVFSPGKFARVMQPKQRTPPNPGKQLQLQQHRNLELGGANSRAKH